MCACHTISHSCLLEIAEVAPYVRDVNHPFWHRFENLKGAGNSASAAAQASRSSETIPAAAVPSCVCWRSCPSLPRLDERRARLPCQGPTLENQLAALQGVHCPTSLRLGDGMPPHCFAATRHAAEVVARESLQRIIAWVNAHLARLLRVADRKH